MKRLQRSSLRLCDAALPKKEGGVVMKSLNLLLHGNSLPMSRLLLSDEDLLDNVLRVLALRPLHTSSGRTQMSACPFAKDGAVMRQNQLLQTASQVTGDSFDMSQLELFLDFNISKVDTGLAVLGCI